MVMSAVFATSYFPPKIIYSDRNIDRRDTKTTSLIPRRGFYDSRSSILSI